MAENEDSDGITLRADRKIAEESSEIAKKKGMTMKAYTTQALTNENKKYKTSLIYLLELLEKHPMIKIHRDIINRELSNAPRGIISPAIELAERNNCLSFEIIKDFKDVEDKLKTDKDISAVYMLAVINARAIKASGMINKVFEYLGKPNQLVRVEVMPSIDVEEDRILLFISYKKEEEKNVKEN